MNSPDIEHAARIVREGGVIAYPTESVFGLGCDPLNHEAIERILRLKHRDTDKGLILIAASVSQLEPYLKPVEEHRWREALSTWPGPVTWLMPAAPDIPDNLTGQHETLAVRVTAHETAAGLCRACATAIVSTSANRSGQPAARTAAEAQEIFGDLIDFCINAPTGGLENPSEIRDALSGKIIRPG